MTRDLSNQTRSEISIQPLTYGQKALLFLQEMSSGHAYNMSYSWFVRSTFDVNAFSNVLAKMTERHPVWRSTFGEHQGEMVQLVHQTMPVPFHEVDASDWADGEEKERLKAEIYRPFQLSKEPPVRWILFRRGDRDPILFMGLHHMATDVGSVIMALLEIRELYEAEIKGEELHLPQLTLTNQDFVKWQNEYLESSKGASALEFWKEQLSGELSVLNIHTDEQRSPLPHYIGETKLIPLPSALMEQLLHVGKESGASPFMTCLAVYFTFLHRYTGQTDICVGVPTAGRDERFASLFHYYVSPVVMRAYPEGKLSFRELLTQLIPTVTAVLKNQSYPFPLIAQKIPHDHDPSRPPIFQTEFIYENVARFSAGRPFLSLDQSGNEIWELGEIQLERILYKLQQDEFDIIFKMVKIGPTFYAQFDYNPKLFHDKTVQAMADNLLVLMHSIVKEPEQKIGLLELLSTAEKAQLDGWNQTDAAYPDLCPYRLFEKRVEAHPVRTALIDGENCLSYEGLNAKANQLARRLRELGVGPDQLVGISLERSMNIIVSQFGIQKAGGAYAPLDPNYPEERIQYILEEARVSVVITQEKLKERFKDYDAKVVCLDTDWDLISQNEATNLTPLAGMDHLSHVIYTSGSTGKPKGVAIEHHSVTALIHWSEQTYSEEELSGMLFSTSLNFDLSVYETINTLALGGTVIVAENALYLPTLPAKDKVRVINTVPSAIKELVRMKGIPRSVITVNLAGEPLKNAVVQSLYAIDHIQKVYNLYGPSEDTTYSTWALMERGDDYVVPVGVVLPNTKGYILDANLQRTPVGVPGELYLSGHGLAREYLHRPDLTEERFISNPYSDDPKHSRIYKSGDLIKYREGGSMECLGRIDHQVKIRGFRIELGEIETVLQRHPEVHEAVVMDRSDKNGEKILVGYVTLHPGGTAKSQDLRSYLKELLPDYMVPAFMMILEAMPLNPNGKIDRKLLPEPELDLPSTPKSQPQNEIERMIADVWKEILQIKSVGVSDKFFDVGGTSLLLPRVKFMLEELFDCKIQTTDMFQYPTIRSLAQFLRPNDGGVAEASLKRRRIVKSDKHDIAVVGLAGRFPGADNVYKFWENLVNGLETITHFTNEELLEAGIDPQLLNDPDYVRARGTLGDVSLFDASFFGFSMREAELLDPQHRFFMECSWEALENAGYNPDTYPGRIGVFAGCSMSSYYQFNIAPNQKLLNTVGPFIALVANDKDFLSTRVSYNFNLKGPGVTVQSACSTSLVAIHQACKSLISGESDMALAGGVTIQVPQKSGYVYNEGGIHSPDGHVRPFDAKAKGMVVSSGLGIVVLKRLEDAQADGDHILAVVKGTAINNDGNLKVGYTAPSVEGQADAIAEAQYFGGVSPETVSYIETHGTGTAMGDPIEVAALTKAFGLGTKKKGFCGLGALKSNIGHLDSAAGVAGFIKTVLALKHKKIPATLHFTKPNPSIDFESTPFKVVHELSEWKSEGPRRAGVSAFGIGGTNAHAVLEEAPVAEISGPSREHQILMVSARTPSALEKAATNLLFHLKHHPEEPLADVAFTLQVGRRSFAHRRFISCATHAEAIQAIETLDSKKVFTNLQDPKARPVIFMFSGQGSQYINMARDLYRSEALFRENIDHCCEYLKAHLNLDLRDLWFPNGIDGAPLGDDELKEAAGHLNQTAITQPALFVIEYALAILFQHWGIQPQAMIGHSIGEYVAACLAGVFSLEDGLALVSARGRLMQSQPKGSMMALILTEAEILPYLNERISMATINAPNRCVVAGEDKDLLALRDRLEEDGIKGTILHTSHAFHSWMMDAILPAFVAEVAKVQLNPPQIAYVSNVTGTWITADEATSPEYWAKHLRGTVRFSEGLRTLSADQENIFLEIGPSNTLMNFAKQQLSKENAQRSFCTVRHPKATDSDLSFALNTLGQLWLQGCEVNWGNFYESERRMRVPLPNYPFEHRRFWVDPVKPTDQPSKSSHQAPLKKREDLSQWFYTPVWSQGVPPRLDVAAMLQKASCWLVFNHEQSLGTKVQERLIDLGQEVISVQAGASFSGNCQSGFRLDPKKRADYLSLLAQLREQGKKPVGVLHLWNLTGEQAGRSRQELADTFLDLGFFSLLYLAQALDELGFNDPLKILVVSDHMQKVANEPYGFPEKAPLLGPCRVIPREFPHLTCRSLDISMPTGILREQLAVDQILAELQLKSAEPLAVHRNGYRWLPQYESTPLTGTTSHGQGLKKEGVYLITGGLGGIGLVVAEYLAKTVQARLVLTRRSELPSRETWDAWLASHPEIDKTSIAIQKCRELEQLGAQVLVGAADVSDSEAMVRLVERAERQFGKIHGVIHAAGLFPSGMIQDETPEMARAVMLPKLTGTIVLDELFKNRSLELLVLFSSTSTILGNMGFVDYCASNAYLDAYAFFNPRPATRVVSVCWDGWKDVGMAVGKGMSPEALQNMMGPAEGAEALHRILEESDFPQILVSPLDFNIILSGIKNFLESNLEVEDRNESKANLTVDVTPDRPANVGAFEGPRNETERIVAEIWQESLGVDRVGIKDSFTDLGGDSLMATMVAARMRKALNIKLAPSLLVEKPTVEELCRHIDELRGIAPASKSEVAPPAIVPAPERGTGVNAAQKKTHTARPNLRTPFKEPSSDTEKVVSSSWANAFNLEKVGVNDNFLDLGGHTELATQLAKELSELFKVDLNPGICINDPTPARVAERIEALLWASQSHTESSSLTDSDEEEFEL